MSYHLTQRVGYTHRVSHSHTQLYTHTHTHTHLYYLYTQKLNPKKRLLIVIRIILIKIFTCLNSIQYSHIIKDTHTHTHSPHTNSSSSLEFSRLEFLVKKVGQSDYHGQENKDPFNFVHHLGSFKFGTPFLDMFFRVFFCFQMGFVSITECPLNIFHENYQWKL